jgi:hypothetical protein
VIKGETKVAGPVAGRARGSSSRYWLIAKNEDGRLEPLTIDRCGGEMLLVFSFEEEADLFFELGSIGCDWRVREVGCEELMSVLYGPCAGVRSVALDPLPATVAEAMFDLVRLGRERFVEHLMGGGRAPEITERRQGRRCEPRGQTCAADQTHDRE